MTDIRHYINLVEQVEIDEAPFNSPYQPVQPTPTAHQEPTSPLQKQELDQCREFASADDYAHSEYNPVHLSSYDTGGNTVPARRHEAEAKLMASKWNYFQKLGLIQPKVRDPKRGVSRFI